MKYKNPAVFVGSFTCPHCGTIAQQNWWSASWNGTHYPNTSMNDLRIGYCTHCGKNTLWIVDKMYFPDSGNVPFPNSEMPQSVKDLYLEAAAVYSKSPRGAAALVRLGIQILCKELGETGKNINNDIAELVKKGLPLIVQQSLDIVRVTGNDAVHPGQIDTDDGEVVIQLFNLTNVIVEYMIALPKRVSGIYTSLPTDKIDAIKQRDKK
jgi:hypothetical protein